MRIEGGKLIIPVSPDYEEVRGVIPLFEILVLALESIRAWEERHPVAEGVEPSEYYVDIL
jgi:hypothetical protein